MLLIPTVEIEFQVKLVIQFKKKIHLLKVGGRKKSYLYNSISF